jgi:hypothetical protein
VEVIAPSIAAAIVAVSPVVIVRMRLNFLREQFKRTPDPTYSEAVELAKAVSGRAPERPERAATAVRGVVRHTEAS